jgi:tRNA nucleotidyltransferase/poly(A) polymerase
MTSDPLRVIRAARFSAELGFEIDAATREMMSGAAERVAAVAAERIVRELFLTLNQPCSTPLVRVLDDTGALPAIFPEIVPMRHCSQNDYHRLNVWDHSLEALEKLEGLLASFPDSLEPVAGPLRANLEQGNRRSVLKLATLLHDAGKPESRAVAPEAGRVTFRGHDAAGSRIAERIAVRLKFSVRDQELFRRLIADHMHMIGLSGPGVRPGTILRWFRRLGEDMVLLILLGMADLMATAGPAANDVDRARRLRWCRETIRRYYTEIKDRLERKPLIGGRDLMAIGIPPGPGMGKIIEAVREAQDEGTVQNRDEALDLAAELARQNR